VYADQPRARALEAQQKIAELQTEIEQLQCQKEELHKRITETERNSEDQNETNVTLYRAIKRIQQEADTSSAEAKEHADAETLLKRKVHQCMKYLLTFADMSSTMRSATLAFGCSAKRSGTHDQSGSR